MNTKTIILSLLVTIFSFTQMLSQVTPGDTIHAVKYVIELEEIDMDNQTIAAKTTVTITPLIDNLGMIQLELMELNVDSVIVDGTVILNFTHENDILNVPLSSSISVGDTIDVKVVYNGQPFHESWGGFHYSSGDYAFNLGVGISWIPHNLGKTWFPCIDDFTDRAEYEVIATVPGNMTAVGGGELLEVTTNTNGTKTFHWYLDNPIPTYLASIAIGEYALVEDTYNGIERDIPITYYVRPIDSLKVPGSFARIKEILEVYEDNFGAYDWNRIGYVGTAIGAMEHATNIAYPNFCISGNASYEDLYAHEVSHMWFGDKITCDKAEEMWINEGWATFCANYYVEELDGTEIFTTQMRSMHADVLYSCHTAEGGYHPLNNIPQDYTYGISAYDRGATVVQALRANLEDDIFFDACKSFLEDLAFTSVSSYDMEANFTQNTGIDMSGFFNNWVYHGGTPQYSIDSFNIVPAGNDYNVTVYVKQKRHGPAYVGDGNAIEFTVMGDGWEQESGIVRFDGETGSASILVSYTPKEVFLDLEERYMDATIDNYKVIGEVDEYSFPATYVNLDVTEIEDSAFIQVTHNYAPADTFATAVPDFRMSDYRYWTVRGILPETFNAVGRFFYSKGGLDNTLIFSETDSVAIMYRQDAGMEWQAVDFTVVGTWTIGYIYVDNLQMGDYALGVWDISVSTDEPSQTEKMAEIKVYPNPSTGDFTFDINGNEAVSLDIYSMNGNLVESIPVKENSSSICWVAKNIPNGTYMAILKGKQKRVIASTKIIYLP